MKPAFAIVALIGLTASPALADHPWWRIDRVEDRLDRRESVIDRRVDHGVWDVVEDRLDAIESRADRRNVAVLPRIDRHERRSIRVRVLHH
jgi:hypothetical protein